MGRKPKTNSPFADTPAKVGKDYALNANLREPLLAGVTAPERSGDVLVYVPVVDRITKRRKEDKPHRRRPH
jgi:hypothetical protein